MMSKTSYRLTERQWREVLSGFAGRYQIARRKAGLTHQQVANGLGRSVTTCWRWAYQHNSRPSAPALREIYSLSRVLGCNVSDLLP